jgi:hypothetical protein
MGMLGVVVVVLEDEDDEELELLLVPAPGVKLRMALEPGVMPKSRARSERACKTET